VSVVGGLVAYSGIVSRLVGPAQVWVEVARLAPGYEVLCPVLALANADGLVADGSVGDLGGLGGPVRLSRPLARGDRVLLLEYDGPDNYAVLGRL
jgi:hypothetical protein